MALTVHGGFEWDTKTAAANLSINGVSFAEAATVFGSTNAVYFVHGSEKLVVGVSALGNTLTVAYEWYPATWTPGQASRCRIIRATHATIPERNRL